MTVDFQEYVDCCAAPCAILSVRKEDYNLPGSIRVVCSNQQYRDVMGPSYYEGMPYEYLVPKDAKFEDYCYRAAVLKQPMHAYVETKGLNCWTDQVLVPVAGDTDDVAYCQFVFEFTDEIDPSRMAMVSLDTASHLIKAAVSLLKDGDFEANVREVLANLLEVSGGFSTRIILIDDERKQATCFSEWYARGATVDPGRGEPDVSYGMVKTWMSAIGVSNAIIVKNDEEMAELEQRNPSWVADMRRFEVESFVLIPLQRGNDVVGFLYVTNFDTRKVVEVKELVELLSFFLGSEIANYMLMQRLEQLSNVDALTGVFNRNAMLAHMKDLSSDGEKRSFGIVNVDLNGLKTTNDNLGHDAGDRLLVEAAEMLKKLFYDHDLYRTGGDEFIVMASDITKEAFDRKVDRLRENVRKREDVSFAIGSFWSDGSVDMIKAFREADLRMYADKQAYYDAHPRAQRR